MGFTEAWNRFWKDNDPYLNGPNERVKKSDAPDEINQTLMGRHKPESKPAQD